MSVKKEAELRSFDVVSALNHDGDLIPAGGTIELSQAAFETLKAAGVVTGEWVAEKSAKAPKA